MKHRDRARQQDIRLRALARGIYEVVYPSEEWTSVCFEQAERHGTVHYRQTVAAAQLALASCTSDPARQMILL